MSVTSVGLPMIHNFPGDIRDFTPEFVGYLSKFPLDVAIEEGFGERLGFTPEDYLTLNPRARFVKKEEAYAQDLVVILKCPDYENLELLRDGNIFFSMIHYPTRPAHVEILSRKSINAFSMDTIEDDYGIRLFVDYFGTAFAGCKIAFHELSKRRRDFLSPDRRELRMSVIGSGGVGQACVKSAEILTDEAFLEKGVPGLVTQMLTRSVLSHPDIVKEILKNTDILVDASKRRDFTLSLISNEQVGVLPEHAVILDLSADRYDASTTPMMVKGIEGIPTGSPRKNVMDVDDELYEEIPSGVPTKNRRLVVSSDAWPAVNPLESIRYYQVLLKNYMELLLSPSGIQLSLESDSLFERALSRSSLKHFLSTQA